MNTELDTIIQGAGGGKKSASMPDDTLRSRAYLQLIDAISEGPIEGVQDVLINRTPISNIKDSNYQVRLGMPDDETLNGFDSTESFVQVGTEIDWEIGPTIRTITDQTVDAVKIHMNLNTIYSLGRGGQMQTGSTGWRVDVKPAGGDWQEMVVQDLDNHKATSPVQFQHNIALPGSGPWDIRVRPRYETDRENVEERVQWAGYSTVINGKLAYPHTAIVGINLSAEHVGSSMPSRHYRVKGRKILVPSNYDPIARTYSGVWDGTFKRAWSNCPPWILYDMVENNIFGVRDHIDISTVNKWHLYTIAQYCDALVPSGYKDSQGNPIMEPRYTYNGAITDKQQALDAFRSITTVWRGMGFYSLSQLFTTVDMPQDPTFIYGPSNVIGGRFEYSTSSVKARHSVVLVRFNDPNNLFEPAIEPVIDDKALKQFGWREKTLELAGCSSRSLAHRYGRWVIDTEHNETETVSFSVSLDSVHALPGEIIAVSDPRRVQARLSGRVVSVTNDGTTRRIVLDQPVPDGVSNPVTLRVQKTDGTLAVLTGNIGTNRTRINFTTENAPVGIVENAVYILSSAQVAPRLFRILSIDEETSSGAENVIFNITALEYDPTKFARVEYGIQFEQTPTSLPVLTVNAPTNFVASSRVYTTGSQIRTDIEIGWTPPVGSVIREYRVYANTPTQMGLLVGTTAQNSITHSTFEAGLYQFRIVAVSYSGEVSEPLVGEFTAEGIEAIEVGVVTDLVNAATLQGGTTTFGGKDVRLSWRNMMRVSSVSGIVEVDSDDAIYSHTLLEFYHGGSKVRTQRVTGNSFIYTFDMNKSDAATIGSPNASREFTVQVRVVDKGGRVSAPTSITLRNNPPPVIVPTIKNENNFMNISWPAPSADQDLVGYLVFVKDTDATAEGQTPTATTLSNSYRFEGISNTQYYVTVVAYDSFGITDLNYATPMIWTSGFDFWDEDAPSTPTGLALTSFIEGDGAKLIATWNASPENDTTGYNIVLTEQGKDPIVFVTGGTRYEWRTLPGAVFSAQVQSFDRLGNKSDLSASVSHTVVTDTIPPAVPTGFSASGGFGTIWLKWNQNTEADFSHYELYESADDIVGSVATFTTVANQMARGDLADGLELNYWIRAVDTSGNASAWSAMITASTTGLQTQDLMDLIDEGSFKTGVEPVRIITGGSLPTTRITSFIQFNGTLYKWQGSAYVPVVSATELSGLVLSGQIDARGLSILDPLGNSVFSYTGEISPTAFVTTGGNTINLSQIAANSLTPSIHFVGEFAAPPTSATLGSDWRQNAVYKNSVDGKSYILTGSPLAWMQYLSDGNAFYLTIESSNGTVFRVGQATSTLLKARLFKNGAEVTDVTPGSWFRWRRVSADSAADTVWNSNYQTGYKEISINVDTVNARATFFCDIIST